MANFDLLRRSQQEYDTANGYSKRASCAEAAFMASCPYTRWSLLKPLIQERVPDQMSRQAHRNRPSTD